MVVALNKRAIMTLFSGSHDANSHKVRLVLAEKGINCDILDVINNVRAREELRELNPYDLYPTLLDRDLLLYKAEIIMEYLDERFPHPPLLPVYPIARSKARLTIYRINKDWYRLMDLILGSDEKIKPQARVELADSLTSVAQVFKEMPYFLSEEFSMLDCCLLPLLWRLPVMQIELPLAADPIVDYAERLFQRDTFVKSLTEVEKGLRKK